MAGMNARLFLGAVRDAPILVPLVVGVLAGLCEETLFRGPMQTAMVKRLGRWPGLVVVAMAFALAHLDIHGVPLRGGIGLVLGWMVVRTGSVFPAMIAHGVYDGTQLALASWVVHKEGYEAALAQTVGHGATAGEVMQGEGARAVVGLVVAVAGVWMIGWFWRREAPIDAKIPAEVS